MAFKSKGYQFQHEKSVKLKTIITFTFTTFRAYGVKVVLFFRLEAVFTLKSALKVECQTQKHQVLQFPKKLVIFNKIIHFYPILDFVQIF